MGLVVSCKLTITGPEAEAAVAVLRSDGVETIETTPTVAVAYFSGKNFNPETDVEKLAARFPGLRFELEWDNEVNMNGPTFFVAENGTFNEDESVRLYKEWCAANLDAEGELT